VAGAFLEILHGEKPRRIIPFQRDDPGHRRSERHRQRVAYALPPAQMTRFWTSLSSNAETPVRAERGLPLTVRTVEVDTAVA
jgi:hypothetical protein